jgi:Flp pilus assembly protein TadD
VTGGDRVPGGPDEAQAAIAVRDRTLARAVAEGQRGLREGNPARAERACAMWTELEPSNVEAWRCYGVALNGVGRHREAVTALRRAAALAPEDAALKAAIVRTEAQLLAQFRNRYGGEP